MAMPETVRWDDPRYWVKISVDNCETCGKRHVLRRGICWWCEQA